MRSKKDESLGHTIIKSELESEICYLTIIQFIMKIINLLNTEVKDDFFKACQRPPSQELPSSL